VEEHFYEILNGDCKETNRPEGHQLDYCKEPIEMDTGSFTIQELR